MKIKGVSMGKIRFFSAVLLACVTMAFGPNLFGPGITTAEPIQPFLNGNFPDVQTSGQPHEVAFENLSFNYPVTFTVVPNQDKIVLGQLNGEIYWFNNDENTTQKNLLLDISNEVGIVWDGGFLGLAIHPEFGTTGKNYFYVYYSSKSQDNYLELAPLPFDCGLERFHGNYLYLERFEVDPATFSYVPNSRLKMIKRQLYNTSHRGGGILFGDDGFLYVTTGDQSTYISAQQMDENLDGGVLRIDVDQDPTKSHPPIRTLSYAGAGESDEYSGIGYWIPNDNPFLSSNGQTFEEYYTIGHRNPHRLTKDKETGLMYIGEIGEIRREEINVVSSGKNYGWPVYEGTLSGPLNQCGVTMYNNMSHERPLTEFQREDASAIIGGYVYRGERANGYEGKYICTDWGTLSIFSVDIGTGDYENIGSLPKRPISIGQDASGELYFMMQGENVKLRKFKTNLTLDGIPNLLSQTGAFTNLNTLEVASGIIPYNLIDSFWSDGAIKKRWMAIPNNGSYDSADEQIQFSENGVWDFPVGSVLIKHFDFPIDENDPSITKRLETRFSIKKSDGQFYFLTYKWNQNGTDAMLHHSGLDEIVEVSTKSGGKRDVTWHYPSNGECLNCHNQVTKGTLGTRTRNLNMDYDYSARYSQGQVANQLVTLSYLGVLDQSITEQSASNFLTHVSIDDSEASLEDRARSYLDLNCAYCHQPDVGTRGNFDLRLFKTLEETGLLEAGVNQPLNIHPDEKIIYPGNADKSILYHRINSLQSGIKMPPLSKGQVDDKGVELIAEWINQLNNFPNPIITTDITTGTAPLTVMFTGSNSSSNMGELVYAWNFGDGNTSNVENPTHVFTVPGNYTVQLKVTNVDGLSRNESILIVVAGDAATNTPDSDTNLALLPDAVLSGTVNNGRGTLEEILYDPAVGDYFTPSQYNEYGVAFNQNLGRPGADDGFRWQVDWLSPKRINYITFGGTYPNQPQPNSMWRISYKRNGSWVVLEEGQGGWINSGIYEWGGVTQVPIDVDALRVQVFSNGNDDVVSIHLRGRGGGSDRATATKATLIQYLPGGPEPDVEPPIITLQGDNPQIIELGHGYTELGATTDDGSTIAIDMDSFRDELGSYNIVYNATDSSGNRAQQVIRTVNVVNTIPPIISLIGANPQLIELGSGYVELGATTDDGSPVGIDSSDFVDAIGTYDIVYTSTDGTNIATTVVRQVQVVESLIDWNLPDTDSNLALASDAILSGTVNNGRGTLEAILYDPVVDNYVTPTLYNEYGESFNQNLGRPGADDGFRWQVDWLSPKRINYITFGGTYPNQPQPNSMWRISYQYNGSWEILDEGQGGWINSGIYEWGGESQFPIEADALRVQIYSDGVNDLVSIHLRGRGGLSTRVNDRSSTTKATLIQYLPGVGPDITAPEIILNGDPVINLNVGDDYAELGATAFDNIDGDLAVTIGGDIVDTTTEGSYVVTYDAIDAAGNTAEQLIRIVNVSVFIDEIAPVISMNGNTVVNLNVGDNYTELGATAVDNIDGEITVIIGGDFVDTATEGSYVVTYNAIDAAGNTAEQLIRTVNVSVFIDETAPVISLNGNAVVNLYVGDDYTELGATAFDDIDGEITVNIGGDIVDTDTEGSYIVTYNAIDAAGNSAEQVTRTVNVYEVPIGNPTDANINLALLPDAVLTGTVTNGRGTPQAILYDPSKNDYFVRTDWNEYGVGFNQNLGRPTADNGFKWQVEWSTPKNINYITFGGTYPNQPQPNTAWSISYLTNGNWTVLEEGIGGWIDSGIYEWGGATQVPILVDALRVQVYSNGSNDLVSIHLRGRGGRSNGIDDRSNATKATLIQYLPGIGPDITAPEITLNGDPVINLNVGDDYSELGATAVDNIDGEITVVIGGDIVDTATEGSYVVAYNAIDAAGNTAEQLIRTVNVSVFIDETAPVISLNGNAVVNLYVGDDYTELGATAFDDIDGEIKVIIGGDIVDTDTEGSYIVTYNASDAAGNLAEEVTRTVNVNEVPIGNPTDANINLALLPDAVLTGTVTNGRGTPQAILYDPTKNDYFVRTDWNEYGVGFNQNLGRPTADNGFKWQVEWSTPKNINYITFGGTYPNQPQPNTAWSISYLTNGNWTVLEEGIGGWIDSGIYEWGGATQVPILAGALRVQVYSNGSNDLVSIHLRGRGGRSNGIDDRSNVTKATLIQYLPSSTQTARAINEPFNDLSVFPNPASVETTLRFDQPTRVGIIQVFDVSGRLVKTINGGLIDSKGTPVNVLEMPSGTYFVKTRDMTGLEFQQQILIRRQ